MQPYRAGDWRFDLYVDEAEAFTVKAGDAQWIYLGADGSREGVVHGRGRWLEQSAT